MTSQLTTIPPVRARHVLSLLLLRQRSGGLLRRASGRFLHTRRELEILRGEVRQLEYIQISLLGTVDRLLDATATITEDNNDGKTAGLKEPRSA